MPAERAEQARAAMLELFPEGFEERELDTGVELAAYTDAEGATRAEAVFGAVSTVDVAADWGERWREFHHGMRVGSLWVGPPWEAPPEHALPVMIEPGRAFGTGAHPTTRLCLQLLLDLPRGSLLDVGCGSGVLAVAAATLGFHPVLAVDHDPAAVEATAANARRNGVHVPVSELDALEAHLPHADTTVANLTLAAVRSLLPRVSSLHVVTSGYLAPDRFAIAGRTSSCRIEAEGWAADLWTPVEE